MAFPPASTVIPTLTEYQFGYLFTPGSSVGFGGIVNPLTSNAGAGTALVASPSGLDMPPVNTGDTQRPLDHGEYIGLDTSQGRDIGIDQIVWATSAVVFDAICKLLSLALWPAGTTEQPLVVQMPSGVYGVMARPRKSAFVNGRLNNEVVQAFGTTHSVMFHATDPRIYALPTLTQTVGVSAPGGGMSVNPVAFPIVFAAGGTISAVGCLNNGTVEMRPVFVFNGPCTSPVVTNTTATGSPFFGFAIPLAVGDTLTVDTDFQSAVYRPGGLGSGSSVRNLLMSGSTFFNFPPGVTQNLQFTSSDAGPVTGTMTVEYASAYAGV